MSCTIFLFYHHTLISSAFSTNLKKKKMKIVGAYLLAVLGGNQTPSVHDIKAILGSVGIEAEDERIELLLSQVKDKDLAELIACGREQMASVPIGGAVAVAVGSLAPTISYDPPAAEAKKEDKEDVEDSDDDIIGISLFDI